MNDILTKGLRSLDNGEIGVIVQKLNFSSFRLHALKFIYRLVYLT